MSSATRKRTVSALQTLMPTTGRRTLANALDNGSLHTLNADADTHRAIALLTSDAPRRAVPALTAAILTDRGLPATADGDTVTFDANGTRVQLHLDLDHPEDAIVEMGGQGTPLNMRVPTSINDPLAIANRTTDRLAVLFALWVDEGIIAA